ncbi:MAG: diguanylate cyclase [Anaerolineaceae bacterium]
MQIPEWAREFDGAVTVCDVNGIILYMNAKAERTFASDGGASLVGKNVLDCHPEPARSKLFALLQTGKSNVYTIEKNGVKKLIYQSPWRENGEYRGLVELSLELPAEIPHFKRG